MRKIILLFMFLLAARAARAQGPYTYCPQQLPCTVTAPWTFSGPALTGNNAIKPATADAIRFVSTEGDDSNDGLSWGSAKATIAAAISSLPSCTDGLISMPWPNCGYVEVGAGTFTVAATISTTSPFVHINGRGLQVTHILWTGTSGCTFYFSANPFNGDQANNAAESSQRYNLSNLTIDGSGGAAGTCGIGTYNIAGFSTLAVGIQNFAGAGDTCWYNTASAYTVPTERDDVAMEMDNCTVGWLDYFPTPGGGSSGYGHHRLYINPKSGSAQVGVELNGAGIQEDDLDIIVNAPSDATGIELTNNSAMSADHGLIHIEGAATGISTDATSDYVIGSITDIENTTTPTNFNALSYAEYFNNGLAYAFGLGLEPINRGITWRLGKQSDCGYTNAVQEICVPTGFSTSFPLFAIDVGAEGGLFQIESDGSIWDRPGATLRHFVFPDSPGTLALQGGTCSMSSGTTCTASVTYGTHCIAQDNGASPVAALGCRISSGTLTVTASSSNSDTWAWSIVN